MGIVSGINRFVHLWIDTLRQIGSGKIWLLLLALFGINWLVLYAHYNFLSAPFYGVISFWTSLFGEQPAGGFTHYPGHFLLLPYFFGWAKTIISVLLEGAILGIVAMLFYRRYLRLESEPVELLNASLLWKFVAAWALFNVLVVGAGQVLPTIFESVLVGSPRRQAAFTYGLMPLVFVVLLAMFLYVIPSIIVFRDSLFGAIGRSLKMFVRNPFTSFFLAVFIMFFPLAFALLNNPQTIVSKFNPELVYWLLFGGLVADFIANYFWMGTTTRLLVSEEE
jgi:hypothetical protein